MITTLWSPTYQSGKHVEMDKFYTRFGNEKPDAIFEVFGNYCGKNGTEVRVMMIDYAYKNRKTIEAEFRNALSAKSKDIGWWIIRQTSKKRAGDELTVYLLSKMFDRHSLIYTLKEPWCTFVHKVDTELSILLGKSDLVFVYTTHGFGQIVDLPSAMQTTTKKVTRKRKETKKNQQKRCNRSEPNTSKRAKPSDADKASPPKRQQHNRSRKTTTCTNDLSADKTDSVLSNSTLDTASSSTYDVQVNKVSASLSSAHIICDE